MNNMPDNGSRRGLLTVLGVGGLVATRTPVEWCKPVVESVLLPAHAQTTDSSNSMAASCGDSISIPGHFVQCTDEPRAIYTQYIVSIANGCLQVESAQSDTEPAEGVDRFYVYELADPGSSLMQIMVITFGGGGSDLQNDCTFPFVDFSFVQDFSLDVGGVPVDIAVTVTQFSSPVVGVSASNITATFG